VRDLTRRHRPIPSEVNVASVREPFVDRDSGAGVAQQGPTGRAGEVQPLRAQAQIRLGDDAAARRLLLEALTLGRRSGSTATLLFCLLADADRRLTTGDISHGLVLLGVVRAHPAVSNDSINEIKRILGRLDLPAGVVATGMSGGATRDLATVVEELLVELSEGAALAEQS
jgi:hypothetical protein